MHAPIMMCSAALIVAVMAADLEAGAPARATPWETDSAPPTYFACNPIPCAEEIYVNRTFDCSSQEVGCRLGDNARFLQQARLDIKGAGLGGDRLREPSKSELELTIARYSQTIMLDPQNDDAYFRRGIANLYAGSLSKALADITKASELDPQYPYYELWLHMIDNRLDQPSRLGQALSHLEMTKWPAPVVRLFLGQTTAPEVLAAAADPDAETRRGQICEANFYIGQLALQQNSKEEAMRLFRLAAIDCPRDFVEGPAASAELSALGRGR